jgi:hypothetical protein
MFTIKSMKSVIIKKIRNVKVPVRKGLMNNLLKGNVKFSLLDFNKTEFLFFSEIVVLLLLIFP